MGKYKHLGSLRSSEVKIQVQKERKKEGLSIKPEEG
jgi:hypothetical protein